MRASFEHTLSVIPQGVMVYSDEFKMEKSECSFVNQYMNELLNVKPQKVEQEIQSGGKNSDLNHLLLEQYKEALSMFYEKEDEMDIDPLFSEPRPCRKKCKVPGSSPHGDDISIS